jgi:hypothetical protein
MVGRAASVNVTGIRLQSSAKIVLTLLGSAITALVVAMLLAAISISGVQSMKAVHAFLWTELIASQRVSAQGCSPSCHLVVLSGCMSPRCLVSNLIPRLIPK